MLVLSLVHALCVCVCVHSEVAAMSCTCKFRKYKYHYKFIIVHSSANTKNVLVVHSTGLIVRRRKLHPNLAIFGNPTVYF